MNIEQGQVIQVKGNEIIYAGGICFGACILGIASLPDGLYSVGHLEPGTIVTELRGMDSISKLPVGVYQREYSGTAEGLYNAARKINPREFRLFGRRDTEHTI